MNNERLLKLAGIQLNEEFIPNDSERMFMKQILQDWMHLQQKADNPVGPIVISHAEELLQKLT